jgi:hypothetical protein
LALLLAQENKAFRQLEFQGLISHTGLREHSSVALLLRIAKPVGSRSSRI